MSLRLVHDLPPFWDGRPVIWLGWSDHTFVCGSLNATRERCAGCESRSPHRVNLGMVGQVGMTRPELHRNDEVVRQMARVPARRRRISLPERKGWIELTAFRCPECGRDEVTDADDETWVLDASDYGDGGSVAADATGQMSLEGHWS